jgi:geranylgeranyl diphosphate synthase type I
MNFKKTLEKLKKEIDQELEKYLSKAIRDVEKQDKETGRILRHAAKIIMTSGKRIRPILMYFGYVAAGGKDRKKIIKASVGIELIHNYLLIHDDIIDHGQTRHGIETVDAMYEAMGKNIFSDCQDLKHLGNSMAILAGDLLEALGTQVVLDSGFDAKLTVKAVSALQLTITTTIIGQAQDICIENQKLISEKEILAMYKNKTAKYTIENPLKIGAILAGADARFLEKISLFAIPVGMAFQIRDDILGLFETSKNMGKDAGSDIKEGKKTILVLKALEKVEKEDRNFMKRVLGNEKINLKDIKKFQSIIQKTGSLKYNQNLAENLIEKGKTEMKKIEINRKAKVFLLEFANYMIARRV